MATIPTFQGPVIEPPAQEWILTASRLRTDEDANEFGLIVARRKNGTACLVDVGSLDSQEAQECFPHFIPLPKLLKVIDNPKSINSDSPAASPVPALIPGDKRCKFTDIEPELKDEPTDTQERQIHDAIRYPPTKETTKVTRSAGSWAESRTDCI